MNMACTGICFSANNGNTVICSLCRKKKASPNLFLTETEPKESSQSLVFPHKLTQVAELWLRLYRTFRKNCENVEPLLKI